MNCCLEEVLEYKHVGVTKRYAKLFGVSYQEAEIVFEDLMRFFWASEKHELDRSSSSLEKFDFIFIMDEEMKPIDEIWHIFLLYTKDYMDYCEKYFGQYIHHLPDIVPNMEQSTEKFEQNLTRFVSYSYDLLGENTIRRWFGEEVKAS